MSEAARRAAERAARTSYGRLLALLASRSRDIAAAEDALGDALVAALRSWPEAGVPDNPDAWLMTAARRNLGARRARAETAAAGVATLALLDDEREAADAPAFGDPRLGLMFVCTHPAIAPAAQAPLMLQTVLGLDAARIAECFLESKAAMGQRLVRAKARIRDAGIAFTVPPPEQASARVDAVLQAIYAAYGTGWNDVGAADPRQRDLTGEAIWLGRLVLELLPGDAEAHGLLALMLYCEARRGARRDAEGGFVPLGRQNPRAWDGAMLAEAEALLRAAAVFGRAGRFQVEAAIQSVHAQAVMTATPLPAALVALYDLLVTLAPTTAATVARASAYAEAGRAAEALAQLDDLAGRARDYQPWWAARARVLHLLGQTAEASLAATTAAGLSSDPAVRAHLLSDGLFSPSASA